jgi:uncharacterized protein (TIGR03067 family)
MRQAIAAFLLVAVVISGAARVIAAQEVGPKELAALQGAWAVMSVNGEDLASMGLTGDITFTGNNYVVSMNGKVNERGTIKLDASKTPMPSDFMIAEGAPNDAGKTQLGLIEIGKDTVRFHLNQSGSTSRPSSFAPIEGFDLIVVKKKS